MAPLILAVLALAYLLGAIPVGLIWGKARGIDVRRLGSGKTGAANLQRLLGWRVGTWVLLADMCKGALAVLIARWLTASPAIEVGAALCTMAGHNWSVYIKFQGGRGVDTFLGGLLALSPLAGLAAVAVAVVVIALFRYVSLGSMTGALSAPLSIILLMALSNEPWSHLIYGLAGAALIIYQHRDNIVRLRSGTERKLGAGGQ